VSNWRIDDLARASGIPVDTIRYYQRERLLPTGERDGRTRRYGPEHLERLERIRALQERRFSLAAIRALLEREASGAIEALLAGPDDCAYDFDELVDTAGIPAALAGALVDAGLLREPTDHGLAAFDGDDLTVLRAFADMRRAGLPDDLLVEVGRLYAAASDELQRRLVALFGAWKIEGVGGDDPAFTKLTPADIARLARDVRVVADYTQQRNLQRQVMLVLERFATPPAPEVTRESA
jgi:DNA-binding transcriptional MerR regulator